MRLRVGHIQFLNCFPLYYGLIKNEMLRDVELFKGTPTELNHLLITGELDISAISSIEYARNFRDLLLFPDISVSADGEVKSVLLVSKLPIKELGGKSIALTNTSATSQILLKILLRRKYKLRCRFFTTPPAINTMLAEGDAALLIGDPALHAYYSPCEGLFVYDLGKEWKEFTGLPMVFAVWAVRRDLAEQAQELTWRVSEAFSNSMSYSVKNLPQVAASAAQGQSLSKECLEEYFRTLRFELGPFYREGLKRFYALAYEDGFIPQIPIIEFLAPLPYLASTVVAGRGISLSKVSKGA